MVSIVTVLDNTTQIYLSADETQEKASEVFF